MNDTSSLSITTDDGEVIVPHPLVTPSAKRRKRRRNNGIKYKRKGKKKCKKAPPTSLLAQDGSSLGQPSPPPSVTPAPSLTNSTLAITPTQSLQTNHHLQLLLQLQFQNLLPLRLLFFHLHQLNVDLKGRG